MEDVLGIHREAHQTKIKAASDQSVAVRRRKEMKA
jgi:hypothetical protein